MQKEKVEISNKPTNEGKMQNKHKKGKNAKTIFEFNHHW